MWAVSLPQVQRPAQLSFPPNWTRKSPFKKEKKEKNSIPLPLYLWVPPIHVWFRNFPIFRFWKEERLNLGEEGTGVNLNAFTLQCSKEEKVLFFLLTWLIICEGRREWREKSMEDF